MRWTRRTPQLLTDVFDRCTRDGYVWQWVSEISNLLRILFNKHSWTTSRHERQNSRLCWRYKPFLATMLKQRNFRKWESFRNADERTYKWIDAEYGTIPSVHWRCKFHDPRGRGSCARAWPYKLYSENALFFLKSSSLLPGINQTN